MAFDFDVPYTGEWNPQTLQDIRGSYKDASMSSANRYKKEYNQDFGLLKDYMPEQPKNAESLAIQERAYRAPRLEKEMGDFNLNIAAKDDYFRKLQNASILAQKEENINRQIEIARYRAKLAKQQARSAVLGSVLGVAGAVAGTFAAGGNPMGGMAGYQIGSGLGSQVK